ncbi:T9SS type A sorting domain-containing protein [Aureibaculum sp. A20]|uniref:T9SS type A sorting domain-containing protein n=1 Tax=Aureibaculum flavum TaxID=2795986 RepID=A0ABS0WPS6_9FLAO|nr:T9SS type A sorting domain-containing protein [Aureibaculum flavum]MBJ2173986.1 T9SS type A sorting domain-containing protein [Aureibaculum flavum]
MKTKLLIIALLNSILAEAQITKTEAFTTGTKLSFYMNQCGNTIPEAAGKLTFCDRANNLGVVERSYGLNDRGVTKMLPNYFNEDEFYVTRYGLSIRNTDDSWENIPNIAFPLWGNTYLPALRTGFVLPNGKVVLQASNGGILFYVYDRNLKTFTSVDFPNNKYPQQFVYDTDRNLTWAFATSGNTTYLFKYSEVDNVITEVADLGNISIGSNSIELIYNNNHIYLGNGNGLYKINITDYQNSVPVTHYSATTTPSLPFDRVDDLQFDANNDLWMATSSNNDGGIVKFDITNETYTSYQIPTPNNALINIKFNKLAIDPSGLIWAVGQNYSGLAKLRIENATPNWTLLPKTDLTTLGFPITYNPNHVYYRNSKFYFTTSDGSSGTNNNFEVIINDNDVWSGRNDNEEGNLSNRMNRRFTNSFPDNNGGVWWFNRYDDIVVHRDRDDNHQSILIENLGNASAIDDDDKAIIKGGNPRELRKIDFPNASSIEVGTNQANDIKRVADEIWVFDRGDKKIDVYKDDALLTTYNLDEDWYEQAFYFAVDDNQDAWFIRSVGGILEIKKFNTTALTSTTYDLSALGTFTSPTKVTAAPDGGVWFIGNSYAIYQEAGLFYDFKATDYTELTTFSDIVVDTNRKAYIINSNAIITTIENPTSSNPIFSNINLGNYNSILPSLETNGLSALTIDSEGSIWAHGSIIAYKLIDDDLASEYTPNSNVLDIASSQLDTNIQVYPNPTENILNINSKYPIDNVKIYSVLGKKVIEKTSTSSIDLGNLISGVYFVKISSNNGIIGKKIVVK